MRATLRSGMKPRYRVTPGESARSSLSFSLAITSCHPHPAREMHHTPKQMNPLICPMESGLRLKVFSSTQRKHFFAHLKGAEQVHFARMFRELGKCAVTSIHPSGVGRVHPKHDVIMYTDDAIRLRRRLAKLHRKILISGRTS